MTANAITTTTVRSLQGDTVDSLCWRMYGEKMNNTKVVERVLSLNHGLADKGEVLPMGTPVIMPVLTTTVPRKETVQLWT